MFRNKNKCKTIGKTILVIILFFLMLLTIPISSSQSEKTPDTPIDSDTMKTPEFTLTILIDGNGSVDLDPPGGIYFYETSVTLEAFADPEWRFDHWSNGASGTTNPTSVLITDDITVTAHFVQQLIGDLDYDGDVDLSDLAQLLSHYGTPSGATYDQGDLDGDSDVDLSDLAALLGNYGAHS